MFGPEYQKVNTAFKRDDRKLIIPGDWTTPELSYLADLSWRWTEKVDGTNIRIHWNGQIVTIGGRTDNAQVPTFLVGHLQSFLTSELMNTIFDLEVNDVTIYGEGYGPKIQSGGQYRDDATVIVFDVRVGTWWLKPEDVRDVADKIGLETVPVMGTWSLNQAVHRVFKEELVSNWPNARIEGIVGTPAVDLFDRRGDRIITKLKVKDFRDLERKGGPRYVQGEPLSSS